MAEGVWVSFSNWAGQVRAEHRVNRGHQEVWGVYRVLRTVPLPCLRQGLEDALLLSSLGRMDNIPFLERSPIALPSFPNVPAF